ncbi:hypothetical protein PCCS19_18380 [Paenibacillus sp. CCS19]|uniref:hypothetical protein n=1 Tax=Paenibacillus sp. CCS19 TaxID=3158387 RepID=UPI0025646D5D|nr:hypothetical protein [Paenibacillus cellulosilyticus]GMK38784.1 hypothetical protein PCCS19_18380 [Paenibacillus cellulosilyticus]
MGSRVMHYAITSEINKLKNCSNQFRLHLGGQAPDLTHPINTSKSYTHLVEIISSGKRRVNYKRFIHDYKHGFHDEFYIGYLSHLVADYIWYETMYYEYIKPLPENERQAAVEKGYRDFKKLNKILLQRFKLTPLINTSHTDDVSIKGLYSGFIPELVSQLNNDLIEEERAQEESESLELYSLDRITAYIDISVKETTVLLNTL